MRMKIRKKYFMIECLILASTYKTELQVQGQYCIDYQPVFDWETSQTQIMIEPNIGTVTKDLRTGLDDVDHASCDYEANQYLPYFKTEYLPSNQIALGTLYDSRLTTKRLESQTWVSANTFDALEVDTTKLGQTQIWIGALDANSIHSMRQSITVCVCGNELLHNAVVTATPSTTYSGAQLMGLTVTFYDNSNCIGFGSFVMYQSDGVTPYASNKFSYSTSLKQITTTTNTDKARDIMVFKVTTVGKIVAQITFTLHGTCQSNLICKSQEIYTLPIEPDSTGSTQELIFGSSDIFYIFSPSIAGCGPTYYKVFSDPGLTTALTSSSPFIGTITDDSSCTNCVSAISIDRSRAAGVYTYYVQAIDPDGHTEFIVLKIAICGLESMTAKSSTPVTLSPQCTYQIAALQNYLSWTFTNSVSECAYKFKNIKVTDASDSSVNNFTGLNVDNENDQITLYYPVLAKDTTMDVTVTTLGGKMGSFQVYVSKAFDSTIKCNGASATALSNSSIGITQSCSNQETQTNSCTSSLAVVSSNTESLKYDGSAQEPFFLVQSNFESYFTGGCSPVRFKLTSIAAPAYFQRIYDSDSYETGLAFQNDYSYGGVQSSLTLEAEDATGAKATKQLYVLVCGFEKVTALDSVQAISTRQGLVQKFKKSSMLSKFSSSDTTDNFCVINSIVVGKIESGSLQSLNKDESLVLYLNTDGDMEINFSAYKSLTLSTKFAITAASVSGIQGSQSGKGIMQLCLPPYLKTQVENIDVVVNTVNGDWGSAKVSWSLGGQTKASNQDLANSLVFESKMPQFYFNHFSQDQVNVQFTLSSTMTGLSSSISQTSSRKFQITNLKNLFKQALGQTSTNYTSANTISLVLSHKDSTTYPNCENNLESFKINFDFQDEFFEEKVVTKTNDTVSKNETTTESSSNSTAEDSNSQENTEEAVEEEEILTVEEQEQAEITAIKSDFVFPYEDFIKQKKPKIKPLSFKLSVSSKQVLKIEFNQQLQPSKAIKNYFDKRTGEKQNAKRSLRRRKSKEQKDEEKIEKLIKIKFLADPTTEEEESDQDEDLFEFELKSLDPAGRYIDVQINFTEPTKISSRGDGYDQLQVDVEPEIFQQLFRESNFYEVEFDRSRTLNEMGVVIPILDSQKQVDVVQTASQTQAVNNLIVASLFNVVLAYVMNSAMSLVWTATNSLQLVTHFALISLVRYPSCTTNMFQAILKIVTFELIPESIYSPLRDLMFDLPSDIGYSDKFLFLEYETGYILSSMFMMTIIVLLTTIIYCIQYCVYYITKQYDIFPQVKKKMKAKLVERHGFYLRLLIESSMELIICFLVEMFMKQTSTNFEMLSYFTSVAMIAIYVLFVKMIFEVLDVSNLLKMKNVAEFPIYNHRYSALFEDIKIENSATPKYYLFFVIRRLLVASIIVIPPQLNIAPIFQFMALIYSNIFFAIKVKLDQPYVKSNSNQIEFINEVYIIMITNFLFAMAPCSDIQDGPTGAEQRFKIGLIINYVIIALFLSNVVFVAKLSFYDVRLTFRKKFNVYQEKQRLLQIEKESEIQGDKEILKETIRKIQFLKEEGEKKDEDEEVEIPDEHIDESYDEKKKIIEKKKTINIKLALARKLKAKRKAEMKDPKTYLKKSEGPNGTQYIKNLRVIQEEDEVDEEEEEKEKEAQKQKKISYLREIYNIKEPIINEIKHFNKSLKVVDVQASSSPSNSEVHEGVQQQHQAPHIPNLNINVFQMDTIQLQGQNVKEDEDMGFQSSHRNKHPPIKDSNTLESEPTKDMQNQNKDTANIQVRSKQPKQYKYSLRKKLEQ